ncbi:PAS domain-containing protein [Methylobacterium sp. SyP6R]|uniref:PAS domain-containing protein n=1 Tax=Methylobacterium sp. SyP6R TaxID=2718876 RepID=UPI001F02C577|nr:PAS domain-containing protein [Methylobacterium sp. SyP6R]MCF4124055.1 PAS domain-containing protein [Methylobacterium sp. SyP6R]
MTPRAPDPHAALRSADLSSREFMRLIEAFGLTGAWRWDFVSGRQVWSSGLYRLAGLPEGEPASYERLLGLVHPADRDVLEDAAQIVQAGILGSHTVRLIRPDGTARTVVSRGEVFFSPEGRPLAATGVLLDVTDRERLADLHRLEQQRRSSLAQQAQVFIHTEPTLPPTEYGPDFLALVGLRREEVRADWLGPIVPEERPRWRDELPRLAAGGRPFSITPTLRLADGAAAPFRMTMVPLRDDALRDAPADPICWTVVVTPLETEADMVPERPSPRAEPAIKGCHLRAARGLLDWTLNDLARESGVSLSTVRRLEEESEGAASRSRPHVLAALRKAGIVFTLVEGGTVAVARAEG